MVAAAAAVVPVALRSSEIPAAAETRRYAAREAMMQVEAVRKASEDVRASPGPSGGRDGWAVGAQVGDAMGARLAEAGADLPGPPEPRACRCIGGTTLAGGRARSTAYRIASTPESPDQPNRAAMGS